MCPHNSYIIRGAVEAFFLVKKNIKPYAVKLVKIT